MSYQPALADFAQLATEQIVDIKAVLARLGAEGWELVSVTPISSFAGDNAGASDPVSLAGATTEVAYWLKRPKR